VRPAPAGARTPFAQVTFFQPDIAVPRVAAESLHALELALSAAMPTPNVFYAVRATGRFSRVRVRSVPMQERPYPPLAVAARGQKVYDLEDVEGDLVGFYEPRAARGDGVPGFHLHFLSRDRSRGGHVLDLACQDLEAALDPTPVLRLVLPDTAAYADADLSGERKGELESVEKDKE
jgi:acetolactate decarboxylase